MEIHIDIFDAAYHTAHDYPGGAVALAARLGKNPGTFLNKLNPGCETHHLTLSEAVQIQSLSGDHRVLHAMAATLGEICVPAPDFSKVSDSALLELFATMISEGGDFARKFNECLAQKRYAAKGYVELKREAYEFLQAIVELTHRCEGLIDG